MRGVKRLTTESILIELPKKINYIALLFETFIAGMITFFCVYKIISDWELFKICEGWVLFFAIMQYCVIVAMALAMLAIPIWTVFSKETFSINQGNVTLRNSLVGLGIEHTLFLRKIKSFSVHKLENDFANGKVYLGFPGLDAGKIHFSTRNRIFRFASTVTKEEAQAICDILNEILKAEKIAESEVSLQDKR